MRQKNELLLNRYRIVKSLEGGMGIVYLCLDEKNGDAPLALKTYKSSYIASNKIKEDFLREVSYWIEIGAHPNIVKAYSAEFISDTQEIFLSIELVPTFPGKDNASLRSWLTNLPLSLDWALTIANGIAQGMLFASKKIYGLVHRDLKPENILIGLNQEAKITDFGLAKSIKEYAGQEKGSGNKFAKFTDNTAGTPLYKSPEQWENGKIDQRTDMYAIGCIMTEMLTGEFAVYGNSLEELKKNHTTGMALQKVNNSNLPKPLLSFLQKCLNPDANKRYNSWKELSEDLRNISKGLIRRDFQIVETLIDVSLEEQIKNGSSFIAIAQVYITINDPDNALKYFNKAFDIGKTHGHPILLSIATSGLGIVYFNQGEYEKAIKFYQAASDLSPFSGDDLISASNKINICNILFIQAKFDDAKEYALEAIATARKLGELELQASFIFTLANILSASEKYEDALEQYKKVLIIIDGVENHVLLGAVNLGMGTTYFQLGKFDHAHQHFQNSLRYSLQKGNIGLQANSLIGIAKSLVSQDRANEAWMLIEESIKIIEKLSEKHLTAQFHSDIGALLNALGKPKHAMPYLTYAIKLAEEIKLQAIEARSLFSLGMAYELTFDMPNAIKSLKKSIQLFKLLGMPEYKPAHRHLEELISALKN